MKYFFTYETKNLVNGKTYIGVHSTDNLEDGYIGSGKLLKRAIKKHGKENFSSVPLCFFDSMEEAYEEEAFLVDSRYVENPHTYNLSLGGEGGYKGGMSGKKHSAEAIEKMSKSHTGAKNPNHKGYWVTPLGTFDSSRAAAKACGIEKSTLINNCRGWRYQYTKGQRRRQFFVAEGYSFKKNCGS